MTQRRLIGGRYELDGVAGRGGMAEVFRARDIRLDRIVGVKKLLSELAQDQRLQARFRREAQSTASLNHPSIVAVYDTGEDTVDGVLLPYIVMEFVDGRSLRDVLHDHRRLLPERAGQIIDGVLRALDYSHRNGIVHRDIKPGNVMLTRTGEVKVMDFGIARAVSDAQHSLTQTAQVIGTPQYLSPEQARGERVDARSDLYSAGCVFYELLTGRLPFTGDSPVAIAYQHVTEEPVPPSRVHPDVPAWADAIVLKAMAKDPAKRYQSAEEMRAEIKQALAGAPVTAPRRNAWPWVTLAAVIVLLAVTVLGFKFLTGGTDGVGVPSVTGMSLEKAEHAIAAAGLRAGTVSYASSASIAKSDVVSTNPSFGTRISKGSEVNLVVSSGPGPAASHPPSRHSHSASPKATARSTPRTSSSATSPPSSPATRRPSSSPSPSPSPSSSCIVNLVGICV